MPALRQDTASQENGDQLYCTACKVEFPALSGMPWLFAEPAATLGEWRGRLHFALQQLADEIAGLEVELQHDDLRALTRERVLRYRMALEDHRRALVDLLEPLDVQALKRQRRELSRLADATASRPGIERPTTPTSIATGRGAKPKTAPR